MEKQKLTNEEIVMEIYRRMFKQAEPSADIDKIIKSGEGKIPNFFMRYYLPQKIQDKITNEVLDENKIKNPWKRKRFFEEVTLGSSPTGSKEAQERELKESISPPKSKGMCIRNRRTI